MHGLILAILDQFAGKHPADLQRWTLGAPGACAVQTPRYPIVLGELTQAQCRALAEATRDQDYPGVIGPDRTANWFAERAIELGLTFLEPVPQLIHVLRARPNYPGAPGHARVIGPADIELFADWTIHFLREAVPHDPLPSRERLAQTVAEGRHQFWIVDGEPVSMAGIVRRTRHTATIAGVYTPLALRGRGYAGSVTAAVVERIFAEGKTAACLYTDLRNPSSNRCYEKIGFKPACRSCHYPRARVAG
jgi:RimJ/RimL family protein N-acetyltransferase